MVMLWAARYDRSSTRQSARELTSSPQARRIPIIPSAENRQ
jgi:hypothetical protein